MESLDIYPFFIECSKVQPNVFKSRFLKDLAFGRGGLILRRKNRGVLVTPNGEFNIPKTFSETAYSKLQSMLWCDPTSSYAVMQEEIRSSREVWSNVKKRDRFRMIDKYILGKYKYPDSLFVRSIITMALILKVLQVNDIAYDNFNVVNVSGEFTNDYFENLKASDLPTPQKSKLKDAV